MQIQQSLFMITDIYFIQQGNQSTVFPLHSYDDYEYVSVTGDNKELNKEFF